MTIHEAIEQLKSLLEHCKTMHETLDESGEIWARDCEALGMAIAALRGPTREQVECSALTRLESEALWAKSVWNAQIVRIVLLWEEKQKVLYARLTRILYMK